GRLGERGGRGRRRGCWCRRPGFNGAASVNEAEAESAPIAAWPAPPMLQRGRLGERGGRWPPAPASRSCSPLQRGRLGERGGSGWLRLTRASTRCFNGAASVNEAEAPAPTG